MVSLLGVFGPLWGLSGPSFGVSGCHLVGFLGLLGVSGVYFRVPSGHVKSCVFCSVFNGFRGFEGVRL